MVSAWAQGDMLSVGKVNGRCTVILYKDFPVPDDQVNVGGGGGRG